MPRLFVLKIRGDPLPTFNAEVAAPDVDMVSLTEEQEESVGMWLAKNGGGSLHKRQIGSIMT